MTNRALNHLHRKAEQRTRGHPVAAIRALLAFVIGLLVLDNGIAEPVSSPATAAVAASDDDVTKVGLLGRKGFRGDQAVVLGLRLGQTWDEARKIVQANPELAADDGLFTKGGFCVHDRGGPAEGDRTVLCCRWPDGAPGMGRLVIHPRIARFLPAGHERLFVASSVGNLPPDVKSWLGPEDRAVVTLKTRNARITTHVYEKRTMEVSDVSIGFLLLINVVRSISVAFVRPDLLEKER